MRFFSDLNLDPNKTRSDFWGLDLDPPKNLKKIKNQKKVIFGGSKSRPKKWAFQVV